MVMAVRVRARLAALAGVSGRGTLANDGVRRQHVDEQRWREAWRRLEAMVSDAAARRTWARRVARRQPCNVVQCSAEAYPRLGGRARAERARPGESALSYRLRLCRWLGLGHVMAAAGARRAGSARTLARKVLGAIRARGRARYMV